MMRPSVSVVIPTLDEAAAIGPLLDALPAALAGRDWEAVVVDDASQDGTAEAVAARAAREPRLRLIRRAGPRGLAASVRAGLSAARGEYLGSMNADGSHDPRYWPALLAALDSGHEAAIGSRYVSGGRIGPWPLRRRVLSLASTAVTRRALRLSVKDPLSGFYVFRRRVYERCGRLKASGFKVLLEILMKGRPQPVAEIPIFFRDRKAGRSKLSAATVWSGAVELARLRDEAA